MFIFKPKIRGLYTRADQKRVIMERVRYMFWKINNWISNFLSWKSIILYSFRDKKSIYKVKIAILHSFSCKKIKVAANIYILWKYDMYVSSFLFVNALYRAKDKEKKKKKRSSCPKNPNRLFWRQLFFLFLFLFISHFVLNFIPYKQILRAAAESSLVSTRDLRPEILSPYRPS